MRFTRICVISLFISVISPTIFGNVILVIYEENEKDLLNIFESNLGPEITLMRLQMNHDNDNDNAELCQTLEPQTISLIADLSWGGWNAARVVSMENGIPYVHIEASNKPFVEGMDDFLYQRDAIDAALLFETETELDQSLYHIVGNYHLRVLVLSQNETDPYERMSMLRPIPSAFISFGTTREVTEVLKEVQRRKMMRRDSRWNFVLEDFESASFGTSGTEVDINIISMTSETCCGLMDMPLTSDINTCLPLCKSKPKQIIVKKAAEVLTAVAKDRTPQDFTCNVLSPSNTSRDSFSLDLATETGKGSYHYDKSSDTFTYPIKLQFKMANKVNKTLDLIGAWTEKGGMSFEEKFKNVPIPRYFRVGMSVSIPWLYEKKDAAGNLVKDRNGNILYEGYCMDLLKKIAEKLNFEYEVVITKEKRPGYAYGKRLDDGTWTGMIADLANGETDLIVADLTMTSEREEVIDFVSPYFDQAGISIVLRKKVRKQSLFKFLSVLKEEVWLGIIGAVVLTALLIWLLDKYSPYSAQNNQDAYPYPCRQFDLKESFWFALTSLTPQGGGEAPKALSGRVLVAAYWLFVVLMLATFTANLAAFLTVERMQTTVQNLEELARQSKINYTVVGNTSFMEYFVNMAGAEAELYQKWKELTLNSSGNPAKYRVWDYPIKEQYTHVYHIIEETGPVSSVKEGFDRVIANEEGEFAFIHDAARIRYEVYNNCNLTEIGEPFAEQPYALAVQQGSHLQEELSRVILELQKERYFESLQSTYWNSSSRGDCPVRDDSEGITLQSLGGVFIATLIGLVLALITLGVEVFLQKRKEKKINSKVESSNAWVTKRVSQMPNVASGQ